MTRKMYDGINSDAARIAALAKPGDLVGYYIDGKYKWSDAQLALLAPGVIRVPIAVLATTDGGAILDCETGNCTPAQSVGWVVMRREAGADPTVYCNERNSTTGWPAVRAAFQSRGVAEPHYWVANYDGVQVIPAGAMAKQYTDKSAEGYDLSVVADTWPGIDPAPAPHPPQPASAQEIDMTHAHFDLKAGEPVVFTNPGAVTLKDATLLLASDFADASVRVALFSLKAANWGPVTEYKVGRVSGAVKITLVPDTNKVSLKLDSGTGVVGADLLA